MTSDGTNSYAWDAECRLIQITYPGSGNNSAFTYDGLDRDDGIVETLGGSTTSTKQFVWSAQLRCEARDASSNVTAQYFDCGETISSTSFFYDLDHLNSVREMTDSSGNVQAQYAYDPYGRATKLQGSLASDFRYAGYYFHAPSGLSLTLYRAYNPSFGRWISRDPITENSTSLYSYVQNDPVRQTDVFGLEGGVSTAISVVQEGAQDALNVGPANTVAAAAMAVAAIITGQQAGLLGAHNGAQDAFRHCYWSCLMASYLGSGVAKQISDEHENNGNANGQPPNEAAMDQNNNAAGQSCGKPCPNNSSSGANHCATCCRNKLSSGQLTGLDRGPAK